MNTIFFTGNLGRDAEARSTQSGDVCSFSVAVRQGFNRDAPSEWYRCSIWGQRGQSLMTHLKKGAKVAVVGELSISSYEGKPQYNVRVAEIDPFCGGKTEPERGEAKKPYDHAADSGADLDDDVPF